MACIKKCYKIQANSLLESVIALSIISVCLYIAVLVYSSVFSPKTSPKFYGTSNQLDELFFLMQVQNDSLNSIDNPNLVIEETFENTNLKHVIIKYKDSANSTFEKEYFVQINHE